MNEVLPNFNEAQQRTQDPIYDIRNREFDWIISADSIFSSEINKYDTYARFYYMEFFINKFSQYDGQEMSNSAICGHDVKIFLPPSTSCAMILGHLSKEIEKISIKKITLLGGEVQVLEEKEFSKCSIQSFERKGEMAAFTFRYVNILDSYHDFQPDGVKRGTTSTTIDLSTWEVESQ